MGKRHASHGLLFVYLAWRAACGRELEGPHNIETVDEFELTDTIGGAAANRSTLGGLYLYS